MLVLCGWGIGLSLVVSYCDRPYGRDSILVKEKLKNSCFQLCQIISVCFLQCREISSSIIQPYLGAAFSVAPVHLSLCLSVHQSCASDFLEVGKP